MVALLRVRTIGPFEIDGLSETAVGSRKARTLLKVLALARGAPVPSEVLIDALWPGAAPARPADQVAVLVSRLRTVLGADRLRHADAGYALHADWLDIVEFDARADDATTRLRAGGFAGASAAALAALQLVRGPLLANDDGEWVDLERARFERLLARVRLVGAEALLGCGQPLEAAAQAEDALAHDPYDEHALRLLMRAHADAGRPASALARYASARELLASELGVSPTAETEALHTAILLAGEQADRPVPLSLHEGADLFGRERELGQLGTLFDPVAGAAMLVEGEAGIGKTALIAEWQSRSTSAFALILVGRCDELGRDLSLQPVLDALAAYLRGLARSDVAELLGAHLELIGPLVGVSPESTRVEARQPTTMSDSVAGRSVLFAALLDVIERAAGERPSVLVVEDIHLAGASTLAWLRFAMRRGRRLRILATSRPTPVRLLPDATVISLGPLDRAAAASLVGSDRVDELYDRSNGNPLFLTQLAAHEAGELPPSIVENMRARLAPLGSAGASLRTAAVIGMQIDVDLIAAATDLSAVAVLDHLDLGVEASVLREQGTGLAFVHELVREAIAADMTAARRAHTHRQVARVLVARSRSDPIAVAFHARLGGELDIAARALDEAAAIAVGRHDLEQADQLLSDALLLCDTAPLHVARARVRMARSLHAEAADDVAAAIALHPSAEAFELAGWIAYYRRDYEAAYRLADEALRRAGDAGLEASALALGGRVRHSHGDLVAADDFLSRSERLAPESVRGLANVWLGCLRVHQGRSEEALPALESAVLDAGHLGHPFAPLHALFAQTHAYGMLGALDRAYKSLDAMRDATSRAGETGQRFFAVVANIESWLLCSIGQYSRAEAQSTHALDLTIGTFGEPVSHAHLDLAELALRRGQVEPAQRHVDLTDERIADHHTMAWHQRQRVLLMRSRCAYASGDFDTAMRDAARLESDAEARGSRRYLVLARLQRATAAAAAGQSLDHDAVDAAVDDLGRVAGIDAWLITAELASKTQVARWWTAAERFAAAFEGAAVRDPRTDPIALHDHIAREFRMRGH
ncbi:MAG TPA: BTAD domain-containing putative transcriptional regulator [Acidimicrobiales bacterium]|nr:BTAD domain-containing putative transcriptional regulator [Acidimicrobiales bacterium]